MRVFYVTTVFPALPETFVGTEVRVLRRHGVEVSVHALGPEPRDAAAVLRDWDLVGLPTSHATPRGVLRGLGLALARPGLAASLLGFIFRHCWRQPRHLAMSLGLVPRILELFARVETERPDVVHLFWGHYPALLGHLVERCLPAVALSSSLSAYDLVEGYGGAGPVARRAGMVRTWARVNVPAIEALGVAREKIAVVYQCLDDRRLGLDRLGATHPVKVRYRIVAAGRLIPAKGMDEVLEVLRRVLRDTPHATLMILGDGPERSRLEALATRLGVEEWVYFHGHVAHSRVLSEMAAAEVFLLMSSHPYERLPNVVKEAMAAECLCVVTETPGIEELIRDGEEGFVVPQHDVALAARRIDEAFADAAGTARMVERAGERLRREFSGEAIAPRLVARWRALLAKKKENPP